MYRFAFSFKNSSSSSDGVPMSCKKKIKSSHCFCSVQFRGLFLGQRRVTTYLHEQAKLMDMISSREEWLTVH